MPKKVAVIGAGASGLVAAIEAARGGASVTLLEAQERPGRKLLVTGNGRCNLTNLDHGLSKRYHGSGAECAKNLTEQFGAKETLAFFSGIGLLTQEKNGCVYPASGQSSSVLSVLLTELERLKVKLKFNERVLAVECAKGDFGVSERFLLKTEGWEYPADAVILCCGSKADSLTGACSDGYRFAESLGHTLVPVRPALAPLRCRAWYLKQLSGVRCRAHVSLRRVFDEEFSEEIAADSGELQWTDYGVSGIVIFQLSRFVSEAKEGERLALIIDLLPDYGQEDLKSLLIKRAEELPDAPLKAVLNGIANEKLIPVLLGEAGDMPSLCKEFREPEAARLIKTIKEFSIPVTGTASFKQAQVCCGGVDFAEVDGKLESRLVKGLYFAGEMLDVDGPCGGYNLQWAFTSGHFAGKYAAEE